MNYQEMTYRQIQEECKKEGINAKGTHIELLARLGVTEKQPKPPEGTPKKLVPPTQEQLERFLPGAQFVPEIDKSRYDAWLTDERLRKLAGQLDTLAAGKGRWEYLINHNDGSYHVQFSGRLQGLVSTTLIDTDNQILQQAKHYFNARLVRGGNGLTEAV